MTDMGKMRCSVRAATLRKRLAKGLRYANAKRGLRPQLPRLCDRSILLVRQIPINVGWAKPSHP
ncbi:MAG: hypothetical protein F6K53_37800 [Moorea sp. SIO4A1]|uniref:hypothetical protein n=1 Tax=Moorena sp. SIO4A1 TaxID=2607835 RepID=UPI0013B9A0B2|nr:hypothetical protein [Moorena sp. SIO4A1]NEQ62816.1 hypothetical protein [Moorena sp. SIO4A1]NEQ80520.1 hypothetical protein [Moorena sp. SIO2I5]